MTALDSLIPEPRLLERDAVDLAAVPAAVWQAVRHGDLGRSPLVRALFATRTAISRHAGAENESVLDIDSLDAIDRPGFHILAEAPGEEVAVGAIGEVWKLDIPFADVRDAKAFAAFDEPGWVRVAWSLRVAPIGAGDTRLTVEVRVDATDADAWQRFRRYFRVVGPGSHFIRRTLLTTLARGAGFYSLQWLENLAGCNVRNAEVIHPEWHVREGDVQVAFRE